MYLILCIHLVFSEPILKDCAALCEWFLSSGAVKAPVLVTTGTALLIRGR